MAESWNRATILFRDYAGVTAKVTILVAAAVLDPAGSVVQAIKAALDAVSKAGLIRSTVSSSSGEPTGQSEGTGKFNKVEDRAHLVFVGEAEETFTPFEVPAPKESICVADSNELVTGSTPLSTLIAAVSDHCCDIYGQATLVFSSGIRISRKLEKF